MESHVLAYNVRLWRKQRHLTQAELAAAADISIQAVKKLESGSGKPRIGTLRAVSKALAVRVQDLLRPISELTAIRFRSKRVKESVRTFLLADVARRLEEYTFLEKLTETSVASRLGELRELCTSEDLGGSAVRVRDYLGLAAKGSISDIRLCLESAGIKVLVFDSRADGFFGLSVGEEDGGPAVVINTNSGISVERQVFSAAHEFGHLLLHPMAYDVGKSDEVEAEEKEADTFAGFFLMPEAAFEEAWQASKGLPGLDRVLKIKAIFGVSYKTVLYRLVGSGYVDDSVWARFNRAYQTRFGRKLGYKEEPFPLSPFVFSEERFQGLVRRALEDGEVSLDRAAELLRVPLEVMRQLYCSWESVV